MVNLADWDEKNIASVGNLSDDSNFTGLQKVVAQEIVNGADLTGYDGFESGSSQLNWESLSSLTIDAGREVYGTNSLQFNSSNENLSRTRTLDNTVTSDGKKFRTTFKINSKTGTSTDDVRFILNDSGTGLAVIQLQGDGKIIATDSGTDTDTGELWIADTIHELEVVVDFTNDTYDVIFDGTTIASNFGFGSGGSSETASQINEIQLENNTLDSGSTVNAFFDRLTYTNNGADTVNAGGPVIFSETAWNNIDNNTGVVVTESDESTTRPFEIEGDPANNDSAWLWIYGSWDSDGSDQAVVAAGSGDGTNYSGANSGAGANPWEETGINAEVVQHLEESPLTATDSTSNNNDGTVNGASSTSNGQFDGAGSFDGTDDYIDLNGISDSLGSTWTAVAWFDADDLSVDKEVLSFRKSKFLRIGNRTESDEDFTLQVFDGNSWKGPQTTTPTENTFFQAAVAITEDSTVEGFIDGSSEGSESVGTSGGGSDTDNIGTRNNSGTRDKFFDGAIDEVRVYSEDKRDVTGWIQADYDASPKGGQTFFTWSGTTTTVATDTAVTTEYNYTGQTTQEINNRFDTAVSTQYSYTANQTVELNNVTDTATTTIYTVTAQTSRDFENFTDTAGTAAYQFTAGQTTETEVNIATALTANYTYTAQTSSELVINVDQVQTANYSYTAGQSFEQNDVTATAELASYTYTAQITNETVDFFDTAVTADYSYTSGQSTEIVITVETAQTAQYNYTANQTTEFELARIARTTELNIDIDKDQEKTLSGDIDK